MFAHTHKTFSCNLNWQSINAPNAKNIRNIEINSDGRIEKILQTVFAIWKKENRNFSISL